MDVQILDWRAKDVEIGSADSDDSDSGTEEVQTIRKYCIQAFGVNCKGDSVCVHINDFTPYFYIKPPSPLNVYEFESLKRKITELMGVKLGNDIHSIKLMYKKDLWGFNNNAKFPFVRIVFTNLLAMKVCASKFVTTIRSEDSNGNQLVKYRVNGIRVAGKLIKFKLYESNIEPFIRFMHCKLIKPSGWIRVNKSTHGHFERTTCKHTVVTKWKDVESIPDKETIAPLLVASFDIECTSSHGDFPLAKKSYEKVSREIIQAFNNVAQAYNLNNKDNFDIVKLKLFVKDALFVIFEYNEDVVDKSMIAHFSKVYLKQTIRNHQKFKKLLYLLVDDITPILVERVETQNHFTDIYETEMETFRNRFNYSTKKPVATESNKESVLVQLNALLQKNLPSIDGDAIIQIGTTFHRYGDTECFFKKIITLDTCDAIKDVEVISCQTEEQVLLEWTKLIRQMDPDVITGYNILGFDMQFMYDRADELACCEEFCKLGRLSNKSSKLVHKKLSSSALGDNYMHYVDMEGRIMIDLMKVIQRDHNLDSYKLDNVACHFIQGNVNQVVGNRIRVDNLSGVQENSYITVMAKDEKIKVLVEHISRETKEIVSNTQLDHLEISKWGLAKDDVSPNEIFQAQKGSGEDRARIAKYCVQDCALCNAIIIKLEIIANNIGMANVCCVPLSYIFMRGQGVKIFSLVSQQSRLDNTLIPTMQKDDDEMDNDGYEGAIVLTPKPGIYVDEPISVMDYASLYPSSMISENISHDSLVIEKKYNNLPGVEYVDITYDVFEGMGDKKKKVGEKTSRFAQLPNDNKGILPRILKHLLKQRKETRKRITEKKLTLVDGRVLNGYLQKDNDTDIVFISENNTYTFTKNEVQSLHDLNNEFMKAVLDGLQVAYKVTANSLYGQVGAKTSPIYMKELAASTTATGRNLILKAKKFMEVNYDANIVYGDTDSIFVSFRLNEKLGLTGKEALQKSIDLSCKASKEFMEQCLKSPHDLEYEKTFYPFVILSKKRYVGNVYEFDVDKYKQKSMGIVLKRRDNANIVKYIYGGMIDIILNECDVQKATMFLTTSLNDLINGKFPTEELVITKTLKGEYKDPSKIAHRVLADRMGERDPGSKPQVNDRIPYVYIVNKDKHALQGNKIENPSYVKDKNLKPDYGFYISNQIMKPVSQLLALNLEEIPGYTKKFDKDYFQVKEKMLLNEFKGNTKKVSDKLCALRMDEVEKIFFKPLLSVLEAKNNGNKTILECYNK